MGWCLSLAAAFLFPWPSFAAGTSVSGSSITNPDWTPDNSPYVVSGTLEVSKGATLRVEAGTEIRFNPGAQIVVDGELDVLGTAASPVMMTLNTASSTSGTWGGIVFTSNAVSATVQNGQYVSGSTIQNATIQFGAGVTCADASPFLANDQFLNNSVGLTVSGAKASAGSLVLSAAAASDNSGLIHPLYVQNDFFNDNGIGVLVNRNNGRDYVATPAGYSFIGNSAVTSYLYNDTFSSNGTGVNIVNGDNNILLGDNFRYNSNYGLQVATSSQGNVLEKDTINNNTIGADIEGPNAVIIQNNIKNNSNIGLNLVQRPELFSFNNIYNNQYNLGNTVNNLAASQNYWGANTDNAIAAGFLNTVTYPTSSGAILGVGAISYPVLADPFLTQEVATSSVISPTLNGFSTSTEASQITISGVKPVDAEVYINGQVSTAGSNADWSAQLGLALGANSFAIYYQDSARQQSDRTTINIFRETPLPLPALNAYATSTTDGSLILTGSKPAGAGIIINDNEVIPADQNTSWTYNWPLAVGANSAEIVAHGGDQYSSAVTISVTRIQNSAADVIAAEQALSAAPDAKLAASLAGRLLLQVENKGYIWYVYPTDDKRYFISQDSALSIFRSLALGITEANLNLIPTQASGQPGSAALRQQLKGKLLLRVQSQGQISYVDKDGYRHDIAQSNLMNIFRTLSLGISNVNIRKLVVGVLK